MQLMRQCVNTVLQLTHLLRHLRHQHIFILRLLSLNFLIFLLLHILLKLVQQLREFLLQRVGVFLSCVEFVDHGRSFLLKVGGLTP